MPPFAPAASPEITNTHMAKEKNKEEAVEEMKDERRERWEAWLADARKQRPDPTIFDQQRARGEFDVIPDWLQ